MIPVIERIRQIHGIEHATVAVLLAQRGRTVTTVGLSDPYGFHLVGDYEGPEVEAACREAVTRLSLGEHWLAVSPQCGTNLAVTGALTAAAALLAARGRGLRGGFGDAVSAATLAAVAAVPFGRWVQQQFTVRGEIGDLGFVRIQGRRLGRYAYWRVTIKDMPDPLE